MPLFPSSATPISVRLRLFVAWIGMAWERLAAGLWPAATLAACGIALALTDVLPSFPGLLHLAVLLAFLGALAALGWRGLRDFAWPQRAEARARLEAASPVSHRPLTAAEDTLPAGATSLQRALWHRHQTLARAALARLRSPWPAPEVARRDGFAVRAIAVLLLAVALIGTGRDAGNRLARALSPAFGDGNVPVTVKLWITPPAYTNRSPIYLERASAPDSAAIEVPAGSKVLAMVSGTRRKTALAIVDLQQQTKSVELTARLAAPDGSGGNDSGPSASRRAEFELTPAKRLEVRQGPRVLAGWDVTWIADQPPSIVVGGTPRDAGRGRLRIDYTAVDDYGIQSVTGRITRAGVDGGIDITLSVPPFAPKDVTQSSLHDLGGHPWAGMKASLTLTATDQAGQAANSGPVEITVPERTFMHPVAKEIVYWRKQLIAAPERAGGNARQAFAHLMETPAAFNGDRVVFLALASAKYRLSYDEPAEAMDGLPELLWQTAVRIEDGNLGEAEQRLAEAERALREAMERNAPPDEISRLVSELQRTFAEYTRALTERAKENGTEVGGIDNQGNVVRPEDIAAAMEQLRELSRMGAQDAAHKMLANLEKMLQTMRNAAAGDPRDNPELKAAQQMMQAIQSLTERQSQLLDETFEQVRKNALKNGADLNDPNRDPSQADPQRGEALKAIQQALRELAQRQQDKGGPADKSKKADAQPNAKPDGKPDAKADAKPETKPDAKPDPAAGERAADKQEKLRQELKQLSEKLADMAGETPDSLSDADEAMKDAAQSLKSQAWRQGAEAQGTALSNMESGMHDSAEQMMQTLAKKGLAGLVQMPGSQRRFDGPRGLDTDEQVNVPSGPDTEGMGRRVREIRDEIRRRASDRTRPAAEQDYLRRLMKEF